MQPKNYEAQRQLEIAQRNIQNLRKWAGGHVSRLQEIDPIIRQEERRRVNTALKKTAHA